MTIRGYRNPADYRITIADHAVDTSSSALLGIPATPLKFSVWNITENSEVKIGYNDNDGNGALTNQDELYFLESDSAHQVRLTWGVTYDAFPPSFPPIAGDQYTLRTLKPIRSGDTYEFLGTVSSLPTPRAPVGFTLEQNYPNPFNPTTIIRYTISGNGGQETGNSEVRLVVYDVLGRKVAELVRERQSPGTYEISFEGSRFSSGVYFYRLRAGGHTSTMKMVLMK